MSHCEEYLKGLFHDCKSNIERMQERIPEAIIKTFNTLSVTPVGLARCVMGEVCRQMAASFALLRQDVPCGFDPG
ncbi:MAG: hypothetical protein IPH12_09450 [Saprospirales bacterium]|nr:hypothetical protein [Saprospirales bacterium]